MFEIHEGQVLYVQEVVTASQAAIVKTIVGDASRYNTTESDTHLSYQWQIFNLDTGSYEDDITNNTTIAIAGVEYTPTEGSVIIPKIAIESTPTLEEMQTQTLLNTEYLVIMSELTNL